MSSYQQVITIRNCAYDVWMASTIDSSISLSAFDDALMRLVQTRLAMLYAKASASAVAYTGGVWFHYVRP